MLRFSSLAVFLVLRLAGADEVFHWVNGDVVEDHNSNDLACRVQMNARSWRCYPAAFGVAMDVDRELKDTTTGMCEQGISNADMRNYSGKVLLVPRGNW
jgi:hypothetical protein